MSISKKVIRTLENSYNKLMSTSTTFLMKRICALKGVKIGKNSFFWGTMKFHLSTNSLIRIGNSCRFRSKKTSNLIGINRPCIFSTLGNDKPRLIIGDNCGFSGTVIGCFKEIRLGSNVRCGANTLITDSDWHQDDPRSGPPKAINIMDNVWLGVNCVVLKGVTIGENSVIGANSLVVKDIPANVVAAGNPCRVIRTLEL